MRMSARMARQRPAQGSMRPRALKHLAAVAAIGAVVATASSAAAGTQVFLQSASMATSGTARINGASVNLNARAAPITFTGNPSYTITGGNTAIQGLIAQYAVDAVVLHPVGRMHTIFQVAHSTQGFAVGDGVPEPSTWITLLIGFGGLGALARRARRRSGLALAA